MSGTTWLMANCTLPLSTSCSPRARLSPMPTQLNGRTMVYGKPYCWWAAMAKYSTANFWNPYEDSGGGTLRSSPSTLGQWSVDSNTMELDR